jgi:hypothetical protein
LTSSAWVQHRPCPAPSIGTYSLPGMSSWVRGPQASMGRMRSAVPCSTSTGMSILGLTIQDTTGLHGLALSPWGGLGVLGIWAAAALLIGAIAFRLRDA